MGAILIGSGLQTEKASYVKWLSRKLRAIRRALKTTYRLSAKQAEGFGGLSLNDGFMGVDRRCNLSGVTNLGNRELDAC